MKLTMSYSGSLIIGPILYAFGFSIHEIIPLLYTISMMESKSLFIVDDSLDNRLETAWQQGASNGLVFLNKFEGAQMEHVQRTRMTEAAKNKTRMAEFYEITPDRVAQFESHRIAQGKRDFRNRKRLNDSDELRQAECRRNAESRRLAKENVPTRFEATSPRAGLMNLGACVSAGVMAGQYLLYVRASEITPLEGFISKNKSIN